VKNWNYRKTPLSASIALALGVFALPHAYAQDTDADAAEESELIVEEVMVSGVRKSLLDSVLKQCKKAGTECIILSSTRVLAGLSQPEKSLEIGFFYFEIQKIFIYIACTAL
jgi:hypothetical protein